MAPQGALADAIDLLIGDHREVARLLTKLRTRHRRRARTHGSYHDRRGVCLSVRAYPGGPLADAALCEHDAITRALAALTAAGTGSPRFDETVAALTELVLDHLRHEEVVVLPALRTARATNRARAGTGKKKAGPRRRGNPSERRRRVGPTARAKVSARKERPHGAG